jgi:ribosomal protein L7Ae-like RNA K-turn-binding protein
MPHKIVEHIRSACKEHGIQYTSQYDAKRLGELVTNLNAMADEIYKILDRHNIKTTFKMNIEKTMLDIHCLDHELIKLAKQLKNEKEKQ